MTTEEILAEFKALVDVNSELENGFDWYEAALAFKNAGFQIIEDSLIQEHKRWSLIKRSVYLKDKTFVAVEWDAPATEMQEGQDPWPPNVYEVWPEATVKYVKVTP